MRQPDYIRVDYDEPHIARGRQMLAAHPELRSLAGQTPSTAGWIALLVALQMALALLVGGRRWYVWVPIAYLAGATIDHGLWALIHDCCHNLVFKWRPANRLLAILANVPLVVPGGSMSFWKFHLIHHRHMGELEFDAGVPGPTEARVVGASGVRKALWIAFTFVVQGALRPLRIARVKLLDGWTAAAILFQVALLVALVHLTGWGPLVYLVVSTIFAIGLHPLGARWVQEHFALAPGQETYSYYGPLNRVSFNVGYHVEHHDLITVPWSRLPQIRGMAPEFYDSLASYNSWTSLLVRFVRDRNISLFTYVIRPLREEREAARRTAPVARQDSCEPSR